MKNKFGLLALLIFVFVGCRKDKEIIDGPSINEIYSTFKVLQEFKADRATVDFEAGQTVVFSAAFNKGSHLMAFCTSACNSEFVFMFINFICNYIVTTM
jgi:hypothetical protein